MTRKLSRPESAIHSGTKLAVGLRSVTGAYQVRSASEHRVATGQLAFLGSHSSWQVSAGAWRHAART
jgi:hypothetical protein